MKLSVVIAAYDERENVEPLTRRLDAALRALPLSGWEILFVVEGTDGTREVAERLAAELGRIRVLYQERPSGLGRAFRRGFAEVAADADFVLTMDADLNHQPEEIGDLLAAARDGADIVVGSRFVAGSRIEGMPLWKRVLSGAANVGMEHVYGVLVSDKTSGFRLYRADVLRSVAFVNDDFAFLPEILIRAAAAGRSIVEVPIRFVFRTHGVSKLDPRKTTRSYLRLFRSLTDAWSVLAFGALLGGVLLRVLLAFPTFAFPNDADAILTGLRALEILDGRLPVFYSSVRLGAFESYLHAGAFLLFGVSRASLAVAPLLVGSLQLVAYGLLARTMLPRKTAILAFAFLAIPSTVWSFWNVAPIGYSSLVLFVTLALWLAHRWTRGRRSGLSAFGLGLFPGLAIWASLQSLQVLLPAALWLLVRRSESPRVSRRARARLALLGACGLLLGAFPWIAFNVRYEFPSLRGPYGARPVLEPSRFLANLAYSVREEVPELLWSASPEPGADAPNLLQRLLQGPVAALHLIAFAYAAYLLARSLAPRLRGRLPDWALLALVAMTTLLLKSVSGPGEFRGMTARYVLPFFLFVPVALALSVAAIGRRRPALAGAVAGALLLFNAASATVPGSSARTRWVSRGSLQARVLEILSEERIAAVCGPYWLSYPINFTSRQEIVALPLEAATDWHGRARALGAGRWALLGSSPAELERWTKEARLGGRIVTAGEGSHIFLPEPNPPTEEPRAFFERVRAARVRSDAR